MVLYNKSEISKSKKAKWLFIVLAAALWKVYVDGEPKALARKQLSLRFGHFPIGPTSALDDFFKRWQPGQI